MAKKTNTGARRQTKKGLPTYREASRTDVLDREEGFRYYWVSKEPGKVAKRLEEGWETCHGGNSSVKHDERSHVDEESKTTSVIEKHDLVLMRIPEEMAQARERMIQERNDRLEAAITADVNKASRKTGAKSHGEVKIERRMKTID